MHLSDDRGTLWMKKNLPDVGLNTLFIVCIPRKKGTKYI